MTQPNGTIHHDKIHKEKALLISSFMPMNSFSATADDCLESSYFVEKPLRNMSYVVQKLYRLYC